LPRNNQYVTVVTIAIITGLLLTAVPINAGDSENPQPNSDTEIPLSTGEISLWEAYAKGYATIQSSSDGLTYAIVNSGTSDINLNEYAMVMSPNPYQSDADPSGTTWAQDGSLTFGMILAGDTVNYNYGDYVVGAFTPTRPPPPWWCTEDSEFTAPNVVIELTGEIMPFDLWDDMANPSGILVRYDRGDVETFAGETQAAIWTYLRQNAAPVVGKTPMWSFIPQLSTEVDIDLAVTNIGFQAADDLVVKDTLPADYSLKTGSLSPSPSSVIKNADGTTTLTWNLGSMRGAIQTPDDTPTDYAHQYISYTLITPKLDPDERYFLPRAQVDKNNDGTLDSHSEEPLLETYFVNTPPVAVINAPPVSEGHYAVIDGTPSSDPDQAGGDYIALYEWDLDLDGTMDATGPVVTKLYSDNGIFPISLTVTDSYNSSTTAYSNITVYNVAPTATVDIDYQIVEVSIRMAGSKWSNVGMTLYENDTAIGFIEVERWPGNPDDNPTNGGSSIPIIFNSAKTYKAVVTYDPYPDVGDAIRGDQPNNGKDKKDNAGNPVWVILTTENETATKIHHTFNTQQSKIKKSKHWNHVDPWEVELNGYLTNMAASFTSSAWDPGADDITFTWAFDDGYVVQHYYPNSAGTFPVSVLDSVNYSGSATNVKLTCEDDDGGMWENTYSL
jgi:hypothetical protein